ncbi:Site-specific recombinase XerD [Pelagirhabdus alkalitolerans]|uniref:Site-specific recombinase XerD n=1 Tax=Pelagirhabdus alkalitolerans TaxID=1612202 RepID=A0A1G6MYD3_9BACI|nr:tyrosine-type recombinase/integrase [Pelagirhabdus alkalitolerans]SDC60254.1 Site-specific recombinase XerD [Pelagirhabdus alkalitolerans]
MEKEVSRYPNETFLDVAQQIQKPSYQSLVQKRHLAEDESKPPFYYFNDFDMLAYYLQDEQNIDVEKGRTQQTLQMYERELYAFIKNLISYQDDIGIQFNNMESESIFKQLKPSHLEKYQYWFVHKYPYLLGRKSPYSPSTISRKDAIIKYFLSFLYTSGYIDEDLTRYMKVSTVSKDERPNRDLTTREVLQLLDFFSEEIDHPVLFALIHALVTTGMRNSELCRVRIRDIEYDEDREQYFIRVHGKGNKKRLVPLNEKTYNSLNRFRISRGHSPIAHANGDESVILTSKGHPYTNNYLSQYLSKALKRLPMPFVKEKVITPHTFRHAFAILSYKDGADVYTIMRALGHESIQTTMIYLPKEIEKEELDKVRWQNTLQKYI